MEIKRGEIYYIRKGKYYATDPEYDASRPGIIVSNDDFNQYSDYVEIVYLTSKQRPTTKSHVNINSKRDSIALCETIYTVSKDNIGDFVKMCSKSEMRDIDDALLYSVGIQSDICKLEHDKNMYKDLYETLLKHVENQA